MDVTAGGNESGRRPVATPVIISPWGAVVKATCSCNSCRRLAVRGAVVAATAVRRPSLGLQRRRSRASIRLHILPTKVTSKRLPSPSTILSSSPPLLPLSLYFYPANFPLRSKRVRGRYVSGSYRQRGVLQGSDTHSAINKRSQGGGWLLSLPSQGEEHVRFRNDRNLFDLLVVIELFHLVPPRQY